MDKDLKMKIDRWVGNVGIRRAELHLIQAGVSSSTAQKLTRGQYPNQPKDLVLQAIESAMKKSA